MKTGIRKSDFIGLGPNKCGSTWLADKLRLHPQIFLPAEKSLLYFNSVSPFSGKPNKNYNQSYNWYNSHFRKATPGQITGEIGMVYFYMENCAEDIAKYHPGMKFFLVLREPVERVISQYAFRQQVGLSKKTTLKKLLNDNPNVLGAGLYYKHLSRFLKYFPKEQIRVLFYEDLKKDSVGLYLDVLDFLGVDNYVPESINQKSNVTSEFHSHRLISVVTRFDIFLREHPKLKAVNNVLRSPIIHKQIKKITKFNRKSVKEKPDIAPDEIKKLKDYYANDIDQLEKLLTVNLSHWKQ